MTFATEHDRLRENGKSTIPLGGRGNIKENEYCQLSKNILPQTQEELHPMISNLPHFRVRILKKISNSIRIMPKETRLFSNMITRFSGQILAS